MVVCKCRKATKLYCYVHKIPLCAECICSEEHQICVVKTYSEWVIDGDYSWPPKCSLCQEELQGDKRTCRLGCLHVLHSTCLESHLKSFPEHTAPAGYGCPSCGSPVWPPQNFRDLSTGLPAKVKEFISQVGLAGTLLGNEKSVDQHSSPIQPAFATVPLVSTIGVPEKTTEAQHAYASGTSEISVEEPSTSVNSQASSNMSPQLASSLARKNSYRPDKVVIGVLPYGDEDGDDEDAIRRKYARRGPLYKQILRHVLPFWSPALPTLPVTTPGRKDDEEHIEGHARRRHHRHSTVDPRNILFIFAILTCFATMLLLYYRLIQSSGVTRTS